MCSKGRASLSLIRHSLFLSLSLLTDHGPSNRDNVPALPHHADDWARDDVVHKGPEKRLCGEVGVVGLGQASLDILDLEGPELVSPLLKASDDLTDETTLSCTKSETDQACAGKQVVERRVVAAMILRAFDSHLNAIGLYIARHWRREESE